MQALVENRKTIALNSKLRIALIVLKENVSMWFTGLELYYAASTVQNAAYRVLDRTRRANGIPGLNSLALNKAFWEAWDWTVGGDEWTSSEAWKASLISCVRHRYLPTRARILGIGPGAGRWTAELINEAEIHACAQELSRVMTSTATAVVHHGSVGGAAGGWRSNVSSSRMLELLCKRGFEIVESFSEWQDEGTTHSISGFNDSVTVLRLPN